MTMNNVYGRLRSHNKKNYLMLIFCIGLSVMLITSYGLIYFSSTVQVILPRGGDSRKMANMVFAAAILGCGIFTIYAASLFYRYKSREIGIFMALGAPRAKLRKMLFVDLIIVVCGSCAAGILLAFPLSAGIWGMFQMMIIDTKEMTYKAGWTGLLVGVLFSGFVCVSIFLMAVRFLQRTNIIEVLNDFRISEPVKDVKGWYLPVGIVLIVAGFLGGYYGLKVVEVLFSYRIYSVWNLFYLLCFAGVYLLMVYIVVHAKRGNHPERYYRNLISTSMMRFMGRQTVRNMCVIVLLVFGGLFVVTYTPYMSTSNQAYVKNMDRDFMFTCPASQEQMNREEIEELASRHQMQIQDYFEMKGISLIVDGTLEEEGEHGKVTDVYEKQLQSTAFYRAGDISEVTGRNVEVKPGEYKRIFKSINSEKAESEEIGSDDILVTDPVTKEEKTYVYGGGEKLGNVLTTSVFDGMNIILNDADFKAYAEHMEQKYEYRTVSFDVKDWSKSYAFASELKNEIISRTSKENAVFSEYDWFEDEQCREKGEVYYVNEEFKPGEGDLMLSKDNSQLSMRWRYYPDFKILKEQDMMKNVAVMLMLFIYIAIICLAAVGIIAYTRGVSIAMNYRQVFVDLRRLGANRRYMMFCIRGQLMKVFFYPFFVGLILSVFFILLIFQGNDGIITAAEWKTLGMDALIYAVIFGYIYLVYRMASAKFKKIVGVDEKI